MGLKDKLSRHKKNIIREETHGPVSSSTSDCGLSFDIPHIEKWKELGAEPFYFDGTYCLVRKVVYPLSFQHGLYRFDELKDVVTAWNESSMDHPLSSKGFRPEQLFFFDTETTGLGGGAGNTIFLLGQAVLEKNQIVVLQHFLPNPGAEVALYQSFLENVDYTTLVTYNGKSFDWPQVKTRHTLIRDTVPKLPEYGHFDLYHASRRMWKQKLESVRLANVEKEILSIKREGDVPGYLAPMLYFDFIESQNPDSIQGVLHHNEIDVLSLITLYIHLSKHLLGLAKESTSFEKYEVARWLHKLGEVNVAEDIYQNMINNGAKTSLKAKLELAYLQKKRKEYKLALTYFLDVFNEGEPFTKLEVAIELAKLYEHKEKDYVKALHYAREAIGIFKTYRNLFNERSISHEEELKKRTHRISKKLEIMG